MKPNLDELMNDAGIPTGEEVLLAELAKAHSKIYALTNALRHERGQLKQVRRDMQKLVKEKKQGQKQHYRNGQKRGKNGFHG